MVVRCKMQGNAAWFTRKRMSTMHIGNESTATLNFAVWLTVRAEHSLDGIFCGMFWWINREHHETMLGIGMHGKI